MIYGSVHISEPFSLHRHHKRFVLQKHNNLPLETGRQQCTSLLLSISCKTYVRQIFTHTTHTPQHAMAGRAHDGRPLLCFHIHLHVR